MYLAQHRCLSKFSLIGNTDVLLSEKTMAHFFPHLDIMNSVLSFLVCCNDQIKSCI